MPRAQLEQAIAVLMGTPASDFSFPVAPLTREPPPLPGGLPSARLERRPDIDAEAAFFPPVTRGASGGLERSRLSQWLTWPMRFWSVGGTLSETVFDGGVRRAQTEEARAAEDATVASYRQTVLTGVQEGEDHLAALRILAEAARVPDEAVTAAQDSVPLPPNQYTAGTVNYLNVITVQATALTDERTAVNSLSRRVPASVLPIKALGGGWQASTLPSAAEVTARQRPAELK